MEGAIAKRQVTFVDEGVSFVNVEVVPFTVEVVSYFEVVASWLEMEPDLQAVSLVDRTNQRKPSAPLVAHLEVSNQSLLCLVATYTLEN